MKNSKLWSIGLSLFLLTGMLVGCDGGSSSSGDPTPSGSSGNSSSTDSTPQPTPSVVRDGPHRDDGVVILLYKASFSSNQSETVINIEAGGKVLYFSIQDGEKRPITVKSETASITVKPSYRVSQETSKARYASSLREEPTFITVSAPADLIAIGQRQLYGYIYYADSVLYYTPQVVESQNGYTKRVKPFPSDYRKIEDIISKAKAGANSAAKQPHSSTERRVEDGNDSLKSTLEEQEKELEKLMNEGGGMTQGSGEGEGEGYEPPRE